jgi:hypothetical protein
MLQQHIIDEVNSICSELDTRYHSGLISAEGCLGNLSRVDSLKVVSYVRSYHPKHRKAFFHIYTKLFGKSENLFEQFKFDSLKQFGVAKIDSGDLQEIVDEDGCTVHFRLQEGYSDDTNWEYFDNEYSCV